MIVGRVVDGKYQMYSYDKRGQLLQVADMQGNVAEKYVYDPAGNILSKTIDGKTTTFTYDKANQLVSSTCDRKVTKYQYDAAGRLIQEGGKNYEYGWSDKVLAVRENGKKIASFDYQVDGQIAQAVHGGKAENFLWDNLALIHRGETSFINEPYVTGGNPVLSSKQGVMFNDMLGNTLGTKQEKFNPVQMTAFGETKDPDALFTGKPYIGELGYAFLFRNYRADKGKWLSADPLGYPDGWNNFAYVNNNSTNLIDFLGAKVYWCARDLALSPLGNHHFLTFIPDNPQDFNGKTVDMGNGTQGWTVGGQNRKNLLVSVPNEDNDLQSIRELRDPQHYPPGLLYDWDAEMHEIPTPKGMTDTQFINAIQKAINEYQNKCPYVLVDENCAALINTVLMRVGIPKSDRERLGEFFGIDWGEEDLIPPQYFVAE